MGFYVNVKAKKGCAAQINKLWKNHFNGLLIYTPAKIKKEIAFIQSDEKSKHLSYVKTVKIWDETFPIYANGCGQIFIRAYGYDEEESEKFKQENQEMVDKIKFILDHRMLFSKISSLQDAVDTLDMDIKGDYIENGKLKYYDIPSFENLPQKPRNKVFNKCLEMDRPCIWQSYLKIQEVGMNKETWKEIRSKSNLQSCSGSDNITIWQRCESLATARDGVSYGLFGRYNENEFPDELDLLKSVILSGEEFNEYLKTINKSYEGWREFKKNNVVKLNVA